MRNSLLIASFGVLLLALGCKNGSDSQANASTSTGGGSTATTGTPASGGKGFPAVAAIMTSSCMPCHSAKGHRAGLDLSSYDSLMKGSRSGQIVVPKDPKSSSLVQFLTGEKSPRMPQGKPPLTDDQMKVITDWIQDGAKNG